MMGKNIKPYWMSIKKGSAMMITLFFILYLTTLFYYWNQTYKVQISSYRSALKTEQLETKVDLMITQLPKEEGEYFFTVDEKEYKLHLFSINEKYRAMIKDNKQIIRRLYFNQK